MVTLRITTAISLGAGSASGARARKSIGNEDIEVTFVNCIQIFKVSGSSIDLSNARRAYEFLPLCGERLFWTVAHFRFSAAFDSIIVFAPSFGAPSPAYGPSTAK
jgi:hypothetical protein